jgi:hypothetical protein
MTDWVDEIATSPNHRTVGLLAMTEQLTPFSKGGKLLLSINFHPQLMPRKWNEGLSFFRFQFTYKKLKLRLL